jgi:beta-hydroxylase
VAFGSNERLGPEVDPNDPQLAVLTAEQKYYFKRVGNSTFNHKDKVGLVLVCLLVVFVGALLTMMVVGATMETVAVVLGSVALIVAIIAWEPIRVMYIGSCLFAIALRTPEFLDRRSLFPNHKLFEDPAAYVKIQSQVREYLKKLNGGKGLISTKDTFGGENECIGSGGDGDKQWRIQVIKMLGQYGNGMKDHLPALCKALDQSEDEVVACVLSILEPGVKIPMHVGYYKGLMRYMLPITVPKDRDNIWLNVNGRRYTWEEGSGVLWDDTYPHAVYNRTDEVRVVLYMDVLRHKHMPKIAAMINATTVKILKLVGLADEQIKKTEVTVKI